MPLSKEKRKEIIAELKREDRRKAIISELRNSDQENKSVSLGDLASTARSAIESASLGISEPVIGALKGAYEAVPEALQALVPGGFGLGAVYSAPDTPSMQDVSGEFSKGYEADVAQREKWQEEHPYLDIGGQAFGFLSPVGPAAAAFRVGGKVAKGVGKLIPGVEKIAEGAGALSKIATATGRGATEGVGGYLATEGAMGASEKVVPGQSDYVQPVDIDLGEGVATSAKFGGAIGAATEAIPIIGRGLGRGARKLLSVALGGVPESAVIGYENLLTKSSDDIAKISSDMKDAEEKIRNIVNETYQKALNDVESSQLTYDQAKETLSHFKDVLTEKAKTKRDVVKQQFDEAKQKLDDAYSSEIELLKQSKPTVNLANDVVQDVGLIKQKLVEESEKASNFLDSRKERIAIKPILERIDDQIESLKIQGSSGKRLIGEEANSTAARLNKLKDEFKSLGSTISLRESKNLLKALDKEIDYSIRPGEFNSSLNSTVKNIRGAIRQTLGELSPKFNQHMIKVVAPLGELRESAVKYFGDERRALSNLSKLHDPNAQTARDILDKIGKTTGTNYLEEAQKFISAKKTLSSPMAKEAMKQGLPEYGEFKRAETALESATKQTVPEEVKQIVQKSEQIKKFAEAELQLQKAQKTLAPLKIFNDLNAAQKTKQIIAGNNPAIKARLLKAADMNPDEFDNLLNLARIEHQFTVDRTRGSKNVNLWGFSATLGQLVGLGTGAALSGFDPTTSAAGFFLGALVDKYGGRMTQRIVQAYTRMPGIPTIGKINKYFSELPPAVKDEIRISFIRSLGVSADKWQDSVQLGPQEQAMIRDELTNREDFTSVEKSKILSKMAKNDGEIDGMVLRKIMLNDVNEAQKMEDSFNRIQEMNQRKPKQPAVTLENIADYANSRRREDF